MDNKNEKIQLDDITFDDVIAGEGVAIEEITPEVQDETSIETPESKELEIDDIVEEKEEEVVEEKQEVVEEKEEEKDELEDESKDSTDDTVVGEIVAALGYKPDNKYEDTAEGLTALTKDIASKMASHQLDEVLESFPLVKNHLEYVLNGGDSQQFMQAYDPNMDYNKMTIEEDDVRSQKALLQDYFSVKGHDKEFIEEMVQDYADNGKLYNKSEAARQALGKVQAQQKESLVTQQKEVSKQQMQEQQTFWDDIAVTIKDSTEFAGLTVPQKEKSKFFNYLSKPVNKEGYTQRDMDHANAEMDKKLAIDYLMFKGFNLDQITKSLRDKISKNEDTVKNARKAGRRTKSFDIDDLDLSI
mgnify:CR=1 FL=1